MRNKMSKAYYMKTTEGTEIKDFIKKEAGSIGVFMVNPCDRNRFQSVIHSYTKNRKNRKTERKINIKSFPIVIDGFEIVKHIHLVEIMK